MSNQLARRCEHQRVVIHIDFDCYYAQVEMVKNPNLRTKPVGVRQKSILVTCNYLARDRGITKLMPIKSAQEICPELVIVPGEDLTDYRDVSYKVSRHLQTLSPLVERLGLDENFVDATEEVQKRLQENSKETFPVIGHLLKGNDGDHTDELTDDCPGDCHRRLNLGSTIAQEIRDSILSTFQLTCCAGVAHNKLLAKLVGATHKPNQQSVLYPEYASHFLLSLSSLSKIPGIGPSMCKKLASNSIETIPQLQECSVSQLDNILGKGAGITLQNLSRGIDKSPVVPFGKPLSLGLEDSLSKGLSFHDCQSKINHMLDKLMGRMIEDGRIPHTIRLVLRKGSGSRESRQCPLPTEIFHSAKSNSEKRYEKIVSLFMSLFTRMIDASSSSQLTLIGITFAKLVEPEKTSIQRFLKRPSSSSSSETPCSKKQNFHSDSVPGNVDPEVFSHLPDDLKQELLEEWSKTRVKPSEPCTENIPHNIDTETFMELPDEIKNELRQKWDKQEPQKKGAKVNTIMNYFSKS